MTIERCAAATDAGDASRACARQVLEAVPLLMREIRSEMRQSAPAALSVPSLRALIFAHVNPGGSLSDLASHLGVTLPTASVAVDRLAARGLMRAAREDRGARRRSLYLSAQGERVVQRAMDHTVQALAQRLQAVPPKRLQHMQRSLADLSSRVVGTPPRGGATPP